LTDEFTGEDVAAEFGLADSRDLQRRFSVPPSGSADLSFNLEAPLRTGSLVIKVVARAGGLSDGEQHALPILPGRVHLMQSRFAALHPDSPRKLSFPDMAAGRDATLLHEKLVVTVDAQLFQGVVAALPYLVDYPYECTEQTLNRFLSSSMMSAVLQSDPAMAGMMERLSARETKLPAWQKDDPNRKLRLEETPWLVRSRGGSSSWPLINLLDPDVVALQRNTSLAKLMEMQDSSGGFAWFPGGTRRLT
jgi:uncharacterized protein YfaS (alpha-2-macroglobulin family)